MQLFLHLGRDHSPGLVRRQDHDQTVAALAQSRGKPGNRIKAKNGEIKIHGGRTQSRKTRIPDSLWIVVQPAPTRRQPQARSNLP